MVSGPTRTLRWSSSARGRARTSRVSGSGPLMRIIVTGSSGFIGSHLVDQLSSRGHDVLGVDLRAPARPILRMSFRAVDLLNRASLAAVFADFQPDTVIHL